MPIRGVDNDSKDATYFGWNVYSDLSKRLILNEVIQTKKLQASKTFLLESGNVALEIFVPVLNLKKKKLKDNNLLGIVGITVDLTKLIGDGQWRKFVEITLSTKLFGDKFEKDIFRQIDSDALGFYSLKDLKSESHVERFGQIFKLKFKRDLIISRLHYGILILTFIGCILLFILSKKEQKI